MDKELTPKVELVPLTTGSIGLYCKLGEQAYRDHYLHLWPNGDPTPYIEISYTNKVVTKEMSDPNNLHYLIRAERKYIGIAKGIKNRQPVEMDMSEPFFLEKIYFLKAFTGRGYGEDALRTLHATVRKMGMHSVYLLTMRKGRALAFYQKMGYRILREALLPFENAVPEERGMYVLGKILD